MMDKKEREQVIKSCHCQTAPTSGHLGTKKTLARITERFMWPGVTKEMNAMVGIYSYVYIRCTQSRNLELSSAK